MIAHRASLGLRNFAILIAAGLALLVGFHCRGQSTSPTDNVPPKRVLMVFSESRDLPANMTMEEAAREQILKSAANRVDFFSESLDSGRFPNARHYRVFRDYIRNKYAGQNPDLIMMFMSRDFVLGQEVPSVFGTNVPVVEVVVNDVDVPRPATGQPFTGIFQRFDLQGTLRFIFRLQPDTRRVVVIGGTSSSDQLVLDHIAMLARDVDGVAFEFWTNRPVMEMYQAAKTLPAGTVILLGTLQRDERGQPLYTVQVAQMLAPVASVPVYVLGGGMIGSGALGGSVVDFERLGIRAGKLASRLLRGSPISQNPVAAYSNGVPMVDWRALERWHINPSRLPGDVIIRYKPQSILEIYWEVILIAALAFLTQAVTIAALLVQRRRQHRAEAEILKQRTELAHVARVSMMGQLASALTHELNQPLGAILRNAEAAEIYLQNPQPDLDEIRAILTDIRRDDKRAGNVIDRMRSLFKRQKLVSNTLDLRDLVEDTMAMARPDAIARQVKLKLEMASSLPPAQGDRVHVQQVLLNLILNGMDAMNTIPKTHRSLVVSCAATANGNLQVSVTDCGTGVTPDDAVHIFEPFFTTKANGMGMGLAISKTIIEAHGGELWMHSNALEGTTFTFLLPPAGSDKIKPGDLPAVP
jgi:signal transduction histidine kinase